MDVGGDSWNLQLTDDLWVCWVREVDCPKCANIAEGDQLALRTDESARPDALALGDVTDVADGQQLFAALLVGSEHVDIVCRSGPLFAILEPPASPAVVGRGGDADGAVELG